LERKKNHIKLPAEILFQKKKTSDYSYLDNILFALLLVIGLFFRQFKKIKRNINLGIDVDRKDNPGARWKNMAMIALGSQNGKNA
jgi:hypothetical protein